MCVTEHKIVFDSSHEVSSIQNQFVGLWITLIIIDE